jgi:hypothetical protein
MTNDAILVSTLNESSGDSQGLLGQKINDKDGGITSLDNVAAILLLLRHFSEFQPSGLQNVAISNKLP